MDIGSEVARAPGANPASFAQTFQRLTGNPPFRWQERLYERFASVDTIDLPTEIDLPTGLGKTSVMAIWLLARRANPKLPRRLVYVVDRRAVVDQATEYAEMLRQGAAALGFGPLPLSTLRGRFIDNREWLADPSRAAIIVGTIDMIGSRLLFEGYGVSRRMRPYQAGLLGVDALVVLDEAHLCPPFQALLGTIDELDELKPKGERRRALVPAFRLLPLSATGGEAGARPFRLEPGDADAVQQPVVHARLTARKRLALRELEGKAELANELAKAALALAEGSGRIVVYCNTRNDARKVEKELVEVSTAGRVELMVGARRVREREKLGARLRELGFLLSPGNAPLAEEAAGASFLVATSAGEVGVDLDADHMVCDLVAFERMAQRLGRVNRRGGDGREARVDVFFKRPDPAKPDAKDEVTRRAEAAIAVFEARLAALSALPVGEDGRHDASPAALVRLKEEHTELVRQATTPEPLRPALDRAVIDAWSMTSLREHSGRPEPEPWLRGWVDDEPQAQVLWRRWLPWRSGDAKPDKEEVERFFDVARPHASELLEAPVHEVVETLVERAKTVREQPTAGTGGDRGGDRGSASAAGTASGIIVLTPARELKLSMSLANLAELAGKAKKRGTDELLGSLAGAMVVVSAALGGLDPSGLLDKEAREPETLDDGSLEPAEEVAASTIGFRVLSPGEAPPDEGVWKEVLTFSLAGGDEDEPRHLRVVAARGAGSARVGDPAVARRAQSLQEHGAWAAAAAADLADALGLDADHRRMLILAAGAHDLGKNRNLWQDAMAASRSGRPFAKTTRRGDPARLKIGKWTYRHEFGSLRDVERSAELLDLPTELRELALHLIAAHHGHARPVIAPADPAEPPSASEARARDVALRFARLQRDWGPWGLAWWEALLRAADWRASSRLDEVRG
ncbi:MAG: type I-U CRISPR-associated helicase/endonuclease Cas3 [Rhodospirillales bacterium]|nr:type I-U CRISPR-associated helicase/endonuclease Cas3 [Rhodospirillales bacterium]